MMSSIKARPKRSFRGTASAIGRGIRDWSYPIYLLTQRVFVVAFGLLVVLFLPLHAFFSEGTHTAAVWASAGELIEALVDAVKAKPALALGVLFALIVTGWQLFRVHLSKRKVREIIEAHHEYLATHKTMVEEAIMPLLKFTLTQDRYQLVIARVNELLSKICTRLSRTFQIVTNNTCCVTIKIIDQVGNVSTHLRDLEQGARRSAADDELPSFHYKDNTAFLRCVEDKEQFYCANWLPIWWLLGQYRNKHTGWFKLYSATAVLPLRLSKNGEIVAFLCVDNLAGKFPRALTLELLKSYRSSICELLGILGRIRRRDEDAYRREFDETA